MSAIVETGGFFFGVTGSIMLAITLFDADWRVSSVEGSVITTSTLYENLWQSCATDSTGVHNCRDFPSMLALNGYLQACRALMISSLVFGFFSCLCGMVGLQCTKVADGNNVLKGKFATAGGALSIFSGICAGIALSWYAFNITKEFFDPLYPGTKYEIGPALYVGWSGALLDVVGGALLCCSFKSQVYNSANKYTYNYRATNAASSSKAGPQAALPRYESNNSICKYGKNAYV
ncbi:claudin-15 isoform X2 [Bombina bombina]|uniref:claudin-15 isoform X2 n=1 Tax=Bombina bombina TaxID=8345 RepID=UPI00235A7A28|nr:claudin-15 isoform X2 [Bombina bombina]